MVARTPLKQRTLVAPLNPLLLRETLKKVDKCMATLEELQYTVAGGKKVISGVSLSPRSTRGYLRTSIRCKQESLRIKNCTPKKSPLGKFPTSKGGEWQRMSLPAMLVGETVGEILRATQFARDIVAATTTISTKTNFEEPKTPNTHQKTKPENNELRTRRKKEKQSTLKTTTSSLNSSSPLQVQKARVRINFKVSPPKVKELKKENNHVLISANRISPRNKPWAKKTVLFPNPLFLSSSTSSVQPPTFSRTRSPIIGRTNQTMTPHKFIIKSPASVSKFQQRPVVSISPTRSVSKFQQRPVVSISPTRSVSKFQVKIKNPPVVSINISPTRSVKCSKNNPSSSPKVSTVTKLRRSFSPSRMVNRLMSPLKSRKCVQKKSDDAAAPPVSGLKQRPVIVPRRFSMGRI